MPSRGYTRPMHASRLPVLFAIISSGLALSGCETIRYTYPSPAYTPAPPSAGGYSTVPAPRPSEPWVDVTISTGERQIIQQYVAGFAAEQPGRGKGRKAKSLPPGLQKKLDRGGSLPPGWQDKVRRGEVMPVDVYEQASRLPDEVMVQLPPQPPGTILVAVGGKVARLILATREILDVFEVY